MRQRVKDSTAVRKNIKMRLPGLKREIRAASNAFSHAKAVNTLTQAAATTEGAVPAMKEAAVATQKAEDKMGAEVEDKSHGRDCTD
jgi:hypothetical protein